MNFISRLSFKILFYYRLSNDFEYRKRRNTLENPLVALNETNENGDPEKIITNLQTESKVYAFTEESQIDEDIVQASKICQKNISPKFKIYSS